MIHDSCSTLIQFINDWLENTKRLAVKDATYRRLKVSAITFSKSDIASTRLCDLTTRDFQNYVEALINEKYSLSTIKKQMLLLSAAVRFACEQRIIDFNPCAGV